MRTAIDTSVLVDLLTNDVDRGSSSHAALSQARNDGALIICEVVIAELGPLISSTELDQFLDDVGISFIASTHESAKLAGAMLQKYFSRGGKRGRIVADFLVGSHASVLADRLLARDRGFYRDYFSNLKVIP